MGNGRRGGSPGLAHAGWRAGEAFLAENAPAVSHRLFGDTLAGRFIKSPGACPSPDCGPARLMPHSRRLRAHYAEDEVGPGVADFDDVAAGGVVKGVDGDGG